MDHFMEEVVTLKKRALNDILYYISWPVMIFAGIFGLVNVMGAIGVGFDVIGIVMGLINVAAALLIYLYNGRLRTEYEYTFTNGSLDFAQVFNNAKRKSLGSLNVKTIDACGKVSGSSFERYITMKDVKQMRWFLNRGAELYYFYFQKDSNKRIIICEPSAEMMEMIKVYLPRGAWQE